MKRKICILAATVLLFTTALMSDGLCQFIPIVGVANYKHNPIVGNQLQFTLVLSSLCSYDLWAVKKITAVNTEDPTDVYEFSLTPSTQALTFDLVATGEFKNQHGPYEVTIERQNLPDLVFLTDELPSGLVPYPTPRNLRVSFETGSLTPTLSFDPIPGFPPAGADAFYEIRIYDKDYTRLMYRSAPLAEPEVTFPNGRDCPGPDCRTTAEDLIRGEVYIFRADVRERVGPNSFNSASNFASFKVPKK